MGGSGCEREKLVMCGCGGGSSGCGYVREKKV